MRINYLKIKKFLTTFVLVMLLQSCTVYRKAPVSLNEAFHTNAKVKIVKTDNEKICFKKVEQIDGNYYGLKKVNGEMVKTLLNESDIKSIRVLDKTNSTVTTILLVLGILGAGLLVFISTLSWG